MIVIARWKERLQIFLDIVSRSDTVQRINHAQRVFAPIGRLRHRQIVGAADLVQIDKAVHRLNDGQRCFGVKHWLQ